MAHVTPETRRLRIVLVVIGVVGFAGHAIFVDPVVTDTSEHRQTAHELAVIETIKQTALASIANAAKPDHLWKRDAHPAPHGCVKAHFRVDPNIPADLRHGVLAEPGRTYPAWIRFSNGLFSDDNAQDARGMAIKLMDVPGEKLLPREQHESTQDFVMINNPTVPIANVDEFLDFYSRQVRGDTLGYFLGWNPLQWHLREMRVGFGMLERPANPLATAYFSMLPYKLGPEHNIKFSVLPCDPEVESECQAWELPVPGDRNSHYLRDAMIATLTPRADEPLSDAPAARFAFRVQRQLPHANMPIEDASIEWSEARSPYVRVAEVAIPAQRFSSDEQNEFCENLSFNPWHALPAHRPIGGLNRARFVLYDAISARRHAENGVARHEPRGFCLQLDGQPCSQLLAGGRP
jgi:hypothetical protein